MVYEDVSANEFYEFLEQAENEFLERWDVDEKIFQETRLYELINNLAGMVDFVNAYVEQFGVKYYAIYNMKTKQTRFVKELL